MIEGSRWDHQAKKGVAKHGPNSLSLLDLRMQARAPRSIVILKRSGMNRAIASLVVDVYEVGFARAINFNGGA